MLSEPCASDCTKRLHRSVGPARTGPSRDVSSGSPALRPTDLPRAGEKRVTLAACADEPPSRQPVDHSAWTAVLQAHVRPAEQAAALGAVTGTATVDYAALVAARRHATLPCNPAPATLPCNLPCHSRSVTYAAPCNPALQPGAHCARDARRSML